MARGWPARNATKTAMIASNIGEATGRNMGTKSPEVGNISMEQWLILSREAMPITPNQPVNHASSTKGEYENGGNSARTSPRAIEISEIPKITPKGMGEGEKVQSNTAGAADKLKNASPKNSKNELVIGDTVNQQQNQNNTKVTRHKKWTNLFTGNRLAAKGNPLSFIAPTIRNRETIVELCKEEIEQETQKIKTYPIRGGGIPYYCIYGKDIAL